MIEVVERKGRIHFVRKKLCHSVPGYDVVVPCYHRCAYCFASFGYIRYILKIYNLEYGQAGLFSDMPRELERFMSVHKDLKYPLRANQLSDISPPREKTVPLFRKCLEVHLKYEYPLMIFTKVPLHEYPELRELILKLGDKGLVAVSVTITTLKKDLLSWLEPYAPSPERRIEFLSWLKDHGIPSTVRITPLIQGITDSPEHVEEILERVPKGHAVFEYLRINDRATLEDFKKRGLKPYVFRFPFYVPPTDYAREKLLEFRDIAHREGFSFAVCGHYVNFKIQDHRDCCTGAEDFYGRFMPYASKPEYWRPVKVFLKRDLPKTPLMLWTSPDQDLVKLI